MRAFRTWLGRSVVVGVLVGSTAVSASVRDHNPALIRILSAIDIVPTLTQLAEATGEAPEDDLFAVALDATVAEYLRSRAISLLSMYPNDRSSAHLESLADTPGLLPIRWIATYTRIRAFADTPAVSFAKRTLKSPITRLRHAAVRALRWVPGSHVTGLLEWQLERESDQRLRKTIIRMIRIRK
jgi:hypothetical protein